MKVDKFLLPHDAKLLRQFLEAEVSDYPPSRVPEPDKFVEFRIKKIERFVTKNTKAQYMTITSLANIDGIMRQLVIGIRRPVWDKDGRDITINLCTCGKDSHWGWIAQK
jgi:hypothetical protein